MQKNALYENCPVYDTQRFRLRLVTEEDAEDLLACYSDLEASRFFNSDNCICDFRFDTLSDRQGCIRQWLYEYGEGHYARFAIVDKLTARAVGTLEIFAREDRPGSAERVGILRLDLLSAFERKEEIADILTTAMAIFYPLLGFGHLLTKAIPEAEERRQALNELGFVPIPDSIPMPYPHYFIRPSTLPA
ncbi:GNAT family N-acetyltransferase [Gorillibacterium timonense]|uniref:GNAT family N-acetyltransferase n=1 Tax=Gorillibacterium timonense TaxID=1689269 RepID=UPI00071DB99B|nr:GNAT family N-acetyltransferase [Gorillibacterium timonense]